MPKKQKLVDKIRNNKRNVSLQDFETLIEVYGYIDKGGKHPLAIVGNKTMPYKRERRVKACYVTDLLRIIDSLE